MAALRRQSRQGRTTPLAEPGVSPATRPARPHAGAKSRRGPISQTDRPTDRRRLHGGRAGHGSRLVSSSGSLHARLAREATGARCGSQRRRAAAEAAEARQTRGARRAMLRGWCYTETNANIPLPTAGDQVKSTVHIVRLSARPRACGRRSSEDNVTGPCTALIETASPGAVHLPDRRLGLHRLGPEN